MAGEADLLPNKIEENVLINLYSSTYNVGQSDPATF